MFVRSRAAALLIGTACVVAGLTGCSSSGGQPRTLPRLSTTPAATASSVPTADTKADLAAATAVVKRYFRLLNNLSRRMDPQRFADLETPDCSCRKFVRSVLHVAAKHQHYFGKADVTSLRAVIASTNMVQVLVTYNSTEGGIRDDSTNAIVTRSSGRKGVTAAFYVTRNKRLWQIEKIVEVSPGSAR